MKKKLLAMLLAVVMVCGVAGCGKDKTDDTDGQQVTAEPDSKMEKEADTLQKALEGYAADLTAEVDLRVFSSARVVLRSAAAL